MDPSGEFCIPCVVAVAIGLAVFLEGCTPDVDYDCSDVEIALALTDVVCKGKECLRKMVAAFWLPSGSQKAIKDNCVVIHWTRGEMTQDGTLVTCAGLDCIAGPCGEKWCGFCPYGGNCVTLSSPDWHADQYRCSDAEFPVLPKTEYLKDGIWQGWEDRGYVMPGVPKDARYRAVWTNDNPGVGSEESGHIVEAHVEFVIAVYNEKDREQLPAYGGGSGNPYGTPSPCVTKEWRFDAGPYTTR